MASKTAFLFEAHFNDGSFILQTEEDKSQIDPTKNAFADVLPRIDDVIVFGLHNPRTGDTYAVDLRDGSFKINEIRFLAHDTNDLPKDVPHTFRLVRFLRNKHILVLGQEATEESHTVEFTFGWQTTFEGRNIQQTITVEE